MGNDLILRRWAANDCKSLYAWRNHSETRRWAGNQEEIDFSTHERWFARFMADPGRFGFILEELGSSVAQIRFDPAELPGCYRISFSATPGNTGKGYGSHILRSACGTAEMQKAASLFIAETLPDNFPSQKVFQRNGFVDAGQVRRGQRQMLCWLMPSARRQISEHIKMQIIGAGEHYDDLARLLSATGLADLSDDAGIHVFCDEAGSERELGGRPIFHLNGAATRPILDYINATSFSLPLPVEFDSLNVAVAQIAAALKHTAI